MKKTKIILTLTLITTFAFGQNISRQYSGIVKAADSLYKAKDFRNSASKYSEAFKTNGWKGSSRDRYNAACSWALAAVSDSAFFQLDRAVQANYTNYAHIITDPDLNSLHKDNRWKPLLEKIKQNKDKSEANLNKPLVAILDSVYIEDQKYRLQIDELGKQYGLNSKEMQDHWKNINEKDAINLIKVKSILDKYGWLGTDVIGVQGNSTLFLVIQHSDLATQGQYLPMMREAVKHGNAQVSNLALLEDRVALRQGKRQIYGSHVRFPEVRPFKSSVNR